MSKRCAISGKTTTFGRNVSFSKRRTNKRIGANIHMKRIYVPELGSSVRLKLSTHAIRSIDKLGFMGYLRSEGKTLKDVLKA